MCYLWLQRRGARASHHAVHDVVWSANGEQESLRCFCRTWDVVRIDIDTKTGALSFTDDDEHVFKSMVRAACKSSLHTYHSPFEAVQTHTFTLHSDNHTVGVAPVRLTRLLACRWQPKSTLRSAGAYTCAPPLCFSLHTRGDC